MPARPSRFPLYAFCVALIVGAVAFMPVGKHISSRYPYTAASVLATLVAAAVYGAAALWQRRRP